MSRAKPALHPDMNILIQARDPVPGRDIHEVRQKWRDYAARLSPPRPASLQVNDEDIDVGDRKVRVRFYRHPEVSGPQPCVLYLHGGGFIKGDLDSSDSVAWGYALDSGAMVCSVDYRLAPEHPWPAGFDDCYDVLMALVDRADHFGVDTTRIVVGGESAGGFFSAAVAVKARDQGRVKLAGQMIVYGGAGTAENSQSYQDFATGYNLTEKDMEIYFGALYGTWKDYKSDPYAWPISNEDLSGVAPALIHNAEIDPTRDDARAYGAKLILTGVEVWHREAKGMLHGFLRARFDGPAVRKEYEYIIDFIRSRIR
ncbi:MAG: alpha/beta hydrolase [Burkholderiaceae bacterium]